MPTVLAHPDCHRNIGPAVIVATWVEAALASTIVIIRFISQTTIVKKVGIDDWMMLLALVSARGVVLILTNSCKVIAVFNTSLITHAVGWGLGRHFECLNEIQQRKAMK